jgi:EmrB/QacA subfamily drug resistance transporter
LVTPRRLLLVLFVGVLMGALDIAIVGPALPAIQSSFGVSSRSLAWVFNVYVLFHLLGAPLLAKLSDRQGRRAIYVLSLLLFGAGSLLVVIAPSFGWLLTGRAVQAFGSGGIFPVASAVIGDTFPQERRGRALGMIGAVFGIAFLLGPLLGGVLLRWSWHWLFLINVPVVAVLVWQGLAVLPSSRAAEPRPFDMLGAGLLSVVLLTLAWGISHIDAAALGTSLRSMMVLPFLLVTAVGIPLFWRVELTARDPVLHPELLQSGQLRLVAVIAMVTGLSEAGMVFLPSLAVAGLGVEPATASFMLLPLVLTLIVGAPAAGALLDRVGAKRVIQGGLLLTLLGLIGFALPVLSRVSFYVAGVSVGLGLSGLLGAPLRYVFIQEAGEERRGAGQGLLTLCLSVGQLVGGAAVGAIAAASAVGLVHGYQDAMLAVAAFTAFALLASFALRGRKQAVSMA